MINSIDNSNFNNVIPQPAPKRKPSDVQFCGEKEQADVFDGKTEASQKAPSFLQKYGGIIGFCVGAFAGDRICKKAIFPKIKNLTTMKELGIAMGVEMITGLTGQVIANKIFANNN